MNKNLNYKFTGTGLGTKERRKGIKIFETYKKRYHIERYSDLQILDELVVRELYQERYKAKIGDLAKKDKVKDNHVIPSHLLKSLNENLEVILDLKSKLGLLEDQKSPDDFNAIEVLKTKFAKWAEENQGSRSLICPHCSKMVLLKIRTDVWEAQKHPFFKDKILFSKRLVELYLNKKITKNDIAEILGVSSDYVDWLVDKAWATNPIYKNIKADIDEKSEK